MSRPPLSLTSLPPTQHGGQAARDVKSWYEAKNGSEAGEYLSVGHSVPD